MSDKILYLTIGPQGSGKTTWIKNNLPNIIRISQDDQGRDGHFKLFLDSLASGESMVIDRMNFNCKQRQKYTLPAKAAGYRIVFVLFHISKSECMARLSVRQNHPTISVDADHSAILDTYFNYFEPPKRDEYDEILCQNS